MRSENVTDPPVILPKADRFCLEMKGGLAFPSLPVVVPKWDTGKASLVNGFRLMAPSLYQIGTRAIIADRSRFLETLCPLRFQKIELLGIGIA